jgi:uncharacterized protein YifE (UPF0438 family)
LGRLEEEQHWWKGFGKNNFDFYIKNVTFLENYGKVIQAPTFDFRSVLTVRQISKIERVFSECNTEYAW